jgi:syntaxin-binding protein 1
VLLSAIDAVPAERKVVLLDATTVRIVDAVCTLNDILDAGVYLVETVEKRRQPYPTMDAVYFIAPETGTDTSAAAVARDFADPKKPMYRSAHIFFTDQVPNSLFQMLATSAAGPLVKTFQEVYLDFVPFEARAFHLGMPEAGARLLQPASETSPASVPDLELIARKIVAAIVSLNELPTIRYRIDGQGARLANLVQEGIDRYAARNTSFKPVAGGELLLMDRTVDLVAPLLHEFTYQAMVYDLLNVHHENRYDYRFASGAKSESSARTVALDETDALWVAMRHTHIAKCSDLIIKRFNDFVKENKAAVKQSAAKSGPSDAPDSNVSNLAELKSTMNALGEFQELKAQVAHPRLPLHLLISRLSSV